MKNLLFIGDVVGKSGCDFLASRIYSMKKKYSVDITVINGENSAQGNGITAYSAGLIKNNCGADVITTGNHCYKRRDSLAIYDEEYIIRPANYAEATAEKKAMGYFLSGKATAVMGTHTHVQTSDEAIIDGHTGYITDAGMTGPEISVLGVDVKPAVDKLRFKFPVRFKEAETPCFINGVVVTFDEKVGKCTKITRIIER